MNEPSATQSRWTGMGELLRRMLLGAIGAAVGVGLLGAIIGWTSGRSVSTTMAAAYYIVGCILFLLGMFPAGGFSMFRGTLTRRKPTGSRQEPIFLLGIVLIGLGVLADVTGPF